VTTIRQQLRDQLITELNEAPPTGVPEASKRRFVPGQRLPEPRLAVFFGPNETVARKAAPFPVKDRELVISIQAAVAVEDPAEADDAVEPLLAHVADVLNGSNLAGLATEVEELGTEWASGSADLFYHAGVVRYRVRFQTKRNDLSAKQ
jgi:hypothetical protein